MNPAIDIRSLAALSRLDVTEEEVTTLERELPSIIAFVETIQKADVSEEKGGQSLRNVMRDDANPHESGIYTEELLNAAPNREGDKIAVKQVVSRKK